MQDWARIHLFFSIISAIFSVFIITIYIKSKFSNSYAYYFNIFFTLVICSRNIVRIFQRDDYDLACYLQAFFLSTVDKLIQIQITSYSVINYIGLFKMAFYKNNEKQIFIFLTFFSIMYSFILSIIFISQGLSGEAYCCYIKTSSYVKKILDTILSILLLLINASINIKIIVMLCKSKNMNGDLSFGGSEERLRTIRLHLIRFSSEIVFVSSIFLIVIFTVNKIFTEDDAKEVKEIIYEILLLIMELFYTMNREIFKETKRILLCQKIKEDEKKGEDEEETQNEYGKLSK